MLAFLGTAKACGVESDCALGDRTYRIVMPEGVERPGAIVFAHGYRGSAAGTMRNQGLRAMAAELDVAFVAVKSYAEDWRIPGVPAAPGTDGAEEHAYFEALVAALAERHGVDTGRMMLTGFSAGGMLTWQIACDRGALFQAYLPIAGTFWQPTQPETCAAGPVDLIHIHGLSDEIVPLEGRPIATTHQGSVTGALASMRGMGAYTEMPAETAVGLACDKAETEGGTLLAFCTHPGGHSIKSEWIAWAWRLFEGRGAL